MDDPTTTSGGTTFAALAELAEALTDPERRLRLKDEPRSAVPGWDRLPEDVRSTVLAMGDGELEAIGKLHRTLLDNDSVVQSGRMRLSMF